MRPRAEDGAGNRALPSLSHRNFYKKNPLCVFGSLGLGRVSLFSISCSRQESQTRHRFPSLPYPIFYFSTATLPPPQPIVVLGQLATTPPFAAHSARRDTERPGPHVEVSHEERGCPDGPPDHAGGAGTTGTIAATGARAPASFTWSDPATPPASRTPGWAGPSTGQHGRRSTDTPRRSGQKALI